MPEQTMQNQGMEQMVMPSFDWLSEGQLEKMLFWRSTVPG